jgi:N-acetyl-1-D-myo-inositol-2-amino-2-deoxy-alpha-D-glucopyranoside deacetylase
VAKPLTLLLVHAHPDDESIGTGGVMAKYAAEGVRVVCVTCTGGEHGEIVVKDMDTPENHARLGDIRAEELTRALAALNPRVESRRLGYIDSGMMGTPENELPGTFWQANLDDAVAKLVDIVREVKPQVMVGYNSFGGYGHPDHIRAGLIAKAAFEATAGDADAPLKLYETAGSIRRREEVQKRAEERGVKSWWGGSDEETPEQKAEREAFMKKMADAQGPVTTTIDVSDFIPNKIAALREHVTQLPADGFFLALTEEDWRELMPVEEFTLKVSRTGVRLPEDDLLAGVRD